VAKYLLLVVLIAAYAITRNYAALESDPLITIFGSAREAVAIAVAAAVLILSFFYKRFWCRNLCPAGAFLALLNGINVCRRFMPAPRPAECDLGVQAGSELDCIRCDRCREPRPAMGPIEADSAVEPPPLSRLFLPLVVAVAVILAGITFSSARQATTPDVIVRSAGTARDVNVERIKRLIQQRYLSDHEADFYAIGVPDKAPDPGREAIPAE
jgi:hypothetical protein